jgi:DNA polymerase IV
MARQFRRRFNQSSASTPALTHPLRPPKLQRTTTSELEDLDSRSLPEPPDWVSNHIMYSCQRSTPLNPPNTSFIAELEKIKLARLLTLDQIGVRAYATSIAAVAAYPYLITSAAEVLRLPGCDTKIAQLWCEYRDSVDDEAARFLPAAQELEADEHLQHLKLFYEIWGVGADTARKFYFDRGWKDIDDVVEFGWTTLNRVQQIGVKYYDEFQVKIPRAEVESIREVVLRHARAVRGIEEVEWGGSRDMQAVIVGGYRRGKEESGDVDVILSHREEAVTENLVVDVVGSLEGEGWITHTLTLNTVSTDRGQQTLPYRIGGGGHGFDSLDKALCVWQDPQFEGTEVEEEEAERRNPNIHRRVDIIVSPWRTVACAILGWSGGNTFQRDIRRYVKRTRSWKFDSSGVRDRVSGHVLDLESPLRGGEGDTWLDREKRLMNGLGIGWRPPSERCTG